VRLTLVTLRGGTVWDEAPPPGTESILASRIPDGQLVATFTGDGASKIASEILRDLMPLSPSPKLMVLMANLQSIERREGSRIIILR
jgi:hypothetical protein